MIVVFILGYAVGNLLPFSSIDFLGISEPPRGNVTGTAQLQVTVLTDKNISVQNLEVDLNDQPGMPPFGGGPQRVTVLENTINNATVILKTK